MAASINNNISLLTTINEPPPQFIYDSLAVLLAKINLALIDNGSGVVAAQGASITGLGGATSKSGGIGYEAGAGGAATQATNRTTGVTVSKLCGTITLFSAAGSATPATFTVTNTLVAAGDTIVCTQQAGTDIYSFLTKAAAGSFTVTVIDETGTTTEAPSFNFAVIKAVAA